MMFDGHQLKLGEHWETVVPEFIVLYVTMTGEDYGKKLVPWNGTDGHHWRLIRF